MKTAFGLLSLSLIWVISKSCPTNPNYPPVIIGNIAL